MRATVTLGATPEQVASLAASLRPECERDCLAYGYPTGAAALAAGAASSQRTVAVCVGPHTLAIAGVRGESVWVLTSRAVLAHPLAFARASRTAAAALLLGRPALRNYVDARFEESVRWLRWLGAEVGPAVPHNGAMRHPVTLRSGHVRT